VRRGLLTYTASSCFPPSPTIDEPTAKNALALVAEVFDGTASPAEAVTVRFY